MRRLLAVATLSLLLVGCSSSVPGGKVTTPTPESVKGPLSSGPMLTGDPVAGKALFTAQSCGACHTYTPAGTNAKVGPDLDKLADYAKKAGLPFTAFVQTSIVAPGSYVEAGYPNAMPPSYAKLSKQQIADLIAFLTPKS